MRDTTKRAQTLLSSNKGGKESLSKLVSGVCRTYRAFMSTTVRTPQLEVPLARPQREGATPREAPSVESATHREEHSRRLNQLRAGVLGANDGIVSVAGMVVGVAAATPSVGPIAIAGAAALSAGALSMAMGEYVSVSTQKDTETALIEKTRRDLAAKPAEMLEKLTASLVDSGIPAGPAREAAEQMTDHDAVDAHTRFGLGLDEDAIVSPLQAALASLIAFTLGGAIPLLAVLIVPGIAKIPATFAAVVLALALTGVISARLGQAAAGRATVRTILGGSFAMLVTYGIGALLGVSVL